MESSPLFWLLLNLLSTAILAFYSMEEMACVSFNRIRLQYYVAKGMKRAKWLHYMLQKPVRLFGTTLICVNAAMFFGSECARQMHIALELNPDWAPLTQVPFVLIFGELVPMFAARRYAENVALSGAFILYFSAKLLSPLLWLVNWISRLTDWLSGVDPSQEHVILNQDDLQRILDVQQEDYPVDYQREGVRAISGNIFSLRDKEVKQVMMPLQNVSMLPANATVAHLKRLLASEDLKYIPVYHREPGHIVGIVRQKKFFHLSDKSRLRENMEIPWFITQSARIGQILPQLQRNNKQVAVVLNNQGNAVGILSIENLMEEIFGKMSHLKSPFSSLSLMIDRTVPGDLLIANFNKQFDIKIEAQEDLTLAELMEELLGHRPEVGETIFLAPVELSVKETTLTGIKSIHVSTPKT